MTAKHVSWNCKWFVFVLFVNRTKWIHIWSYVGDMNVGNEIHLQIKSPTLESVHTYAVFMWCRVYRADTFQTGLTISESLRKCWYLSCVMPFWPAPPLARLVTIKTKSGTNHIIFLSAVENNIKLVFRLTYLSYWCNFPTELLQVKWKTSRNLLGRTFRVPKDHMNVTLYHAVNTIITPCKVVLYNPLMSCVWLLTKVDSEDQGQCF